MPVPEPEPDWVAFWVEACCAGVARVVPSRRTLLDVIAPGPVARCRLVLFAETHFEVPLPNDLVAVLETCDDLFHLVATRVLQEREAQARARAAAPQPAGATR